MGDRPNAAEIHDEEHSQVPLHSGSAVLRRAVRRNIVSFPSQIPVFLKRPPADVQWRIVLLYFVRGWTSARIGERFDVSKHQVRKILEAWSVRALALGYIQVIDPEAFATCCRSAVECGADDDSEEFRLATGEPVIQSLPQTFPDEPPELAAPISAAPDQIIPDGLPVDSPDKSRDLIAALDVAIAHCDEWRGEFWVRTATFLRDLRTVASAALNQKLSEPAEGLFTVHEGGSGTHQHGRRAPGEERVSHAVA